MEKELTCHECGSPMHRDARPVVFTYRDKSIEVDQPGWYCTQCDKAIHSGEDMLATESEFVALKSKVLGVLGPEEVREVRKQLKLSQRKAGELLGGGPQAFQKYESGSYTVSRPMNNLLVLLNNDPSRIDELSATPNSSEGDHS